MNQSTYQSHGLTVEALLATLAYSFAGIIIMIIALMIINRVFQLNLHKELVEDHNTAFGVSIAGFAIAVAIIIAGTISS